jgi:hypothetical protein
MNKTRSLDAKSFRKRHLGQARIGINHGQDRVLSGSDINGRQRADEVLKNPDLSAAHQIP